MRSNRVHLPSPLEPGTRLGLPEGAARHVLRVLRLRAGDPLVVFDGRGAEHEARIEHAGGRDVEITVGAARQPAPESALRIELVQGISRGERMDFVVQKAVELGVSSIRPLTTSRSVVRLDARRASARLEHWRGVAIAACEQSGRAVVPEVHPIAPLDAWLAGHDGVRHTSLMLDPAGSDSLLTIEPPTDRLTLLVGPEGGLDGAEIAAARRAGVGAVRLGPRVLRTETAALVALSAAQLLWGDLGACTA